MCPPLSPPRRPLHCMGFITWGLLGAIPHPNHDPLHNPQSELHPKSNANPTRDPHPCMSPHSALHGVKDCCSFGLAYVPSLDQTLALATAHSRWDPIPNSEKTTHMGPRCGAGLLGMERGTSPCHFQSPEDLHKGVAENQPKSGPHKRLALAPKE